MGHGSVGQMGHNFGMGHMSHTMLTHNLLPFTACLHFMGLHKLAEWPHFHF